jgi:hypothetical protein
VIHVKMIGTRFVTVYPAPEPKPEEETFPQHLVKTRAERRRNMHTGIDGPSGLYEQIKFKEDHAQFD